MGVISKATKWSQFVSKANLFNITVIGIYAPTTNAKEAEVELFQSSTRPSRTPKKKKKRCPFHHRKLECKSWQSTDTWNNRQVWPWSIKWSRAKANRLLSREHTSQSKHPFSTTEEMTPHMDITRWSILKQNWSYPLHLTVEKLCTVWEKQTWTWLWFRSWAPDCKTQA